MSMTGLATVHIAEVVHKVQNWNPSRDATNQEIAYIDLSAVDNVSKVVNGFQSLPGRDAPSRARQIVKSGDILVSTVRPNLNGVARVPENLDGATASTGFCVLRPNVDKIDRSFLFHWVQSASFIEDMVRKATGASYPAVSDKIILQSEIPLPPLNEQKRIAEILDQADDLRRKRKRANDRLNQLSQAIFSEMFSSIVDAPLKAIGDFAEVKGGKRLPKGCEYVDGPTPHPYIRVSDLTGVGINSSNMKYISKETHQAVRRYIVNGTDVIISIAGTIGVTATVPPQLDGANLTENAAKITPKKGIDFDPTYLAWALRSPEARSQILASTGQVTIGKLALFRIEQIAIPMPVLSKQRTFSGLVSAIMGEQRDQLAAADLTETLFQSLQTQAFTGEL